MAAAMIKTAGLRSDAFACALRTQVHGWERRQMSAAAARLLVFRSRRGGGAIDNVHEPPREPQQQQQQQQYMSQQQRAAVEAAGAGGKFIAQIDEHVLMSESRLPPQSLHRSIHTKSTRIAMQCRWCILPRRRVVPARARASPLPTVRHVVLGVVLSLGRKGAWRTGCFTLTASIWNWKCDGFVPAVRI